MNPFSEQISVYDQQKRALFNEGSAVLDVFIIDRIMLADDVGNYYLMVSWLIFFT